MDFYCSICNKPFKSYQSIWNHNKKFHTESNIYNKDKQFSCDKCNKKFTRKQNLTIHLNNSCKGVVTNQEIVPNIKKQELANTINNNNINTNNGPINNGTVNNTYIYINKTGSESLSDLSKQDIKEIFDKNIDSFGTFIKKINFNENLPSNHSFCTTNLEGPYLSVFDESKSKITKDRKKYFFEQLFCITINKMKELYEVNKSHFKKEKQEQIEDTLKRLGELKDTDMNTKIYKEMIKKLNMLSYNDREIVQETWKNKKVKSKVPKTFEEDLEMNSDEDLDNSSSSESEDEINDRILTKKFIKSKKNIIV